MLELDHAEPDCRRKVEATWRQGFQFKATFQRLVRLTNIRHLLTRVQYMEQRTYMDVLRLPLYYQLSVNVTQKTRIPEAFPRLRKKMSDLYLTISIIQYV